MLRQRATAALRQTTCGNRQWTLLPAAVPYYGAFELKDEKLTFRKVKGVELVDVPDGSLVYDKAHDRVTLLNLTAAAVLELCDGRTDAMEIASLMQDAFQLPEPPRSDVEACLRSLVSEGLVETSSGEGVISRLKKRFMEAIR